MPSWANVNWKIKWKSNFLVCNVCEPGYRSLLFWQSCAHPRELHQINERFLPPSITKFPPQYQFPARWCPPLLQFNRAGGIGRKSSRFLDCKREPTPGRALFPNFTPLDFFICKFVKDKVYETPCPGFTRLQRWITTAVRPIQAGTGVLRVVQIYFRLEQVVHGGFTSLQTGMAVAW